MNGYDFNAGDEIENSYFRRNKTPRKGREKYVQTCTGMVLGWCRDGAGTEGVCKVFLLSIWTLATPVPAPLVTVTLLPSIIKVSTNMVKKG